MLAALAPMPHGLARLLAWRRIRFALLASLPFGVVLSLGSVMPMTTWIGRSMTIGLCAVLAFGVLEQWPARLPARLARWVLQLIGIVAAVLLGAWLGVAWTGGEWNFWHDRLRANGFFSLSVTGAMFAPWMALAAMLRQRDAMAREQALGFQLERSELERQALDARLRLLQAQVQPHFLFNTLANVRALVITGSPRAPAVLDSLIAYLRAAVPRLDDPAATVGQELQLVRAYLELMQMRMPDRLTFDLQVDTAASALRCPPMALLTLVENAVRHGIDPSEEGGRIEVGVSVKEGRCIARVVDTGVGLQATASPSGTGLATLRERLRLAFAGDARLALAAQTQHGVRAELEFPAERVS